MSHSPTPLGRTLAALACAVLLVSPAPASADTCAGLSLTTLTSALAGNSPAGVAVGDFDRDGKLDVAVVNTASNSVSILIGDGMGGFTPSTISTSGGGFTNPIDIAAGDLDQDGILDLVVASGSTAQARVLQGTGGGGFSAGAPFVLNAIPTRIYLGEFTGNADPDLVVLAEAQQRVLLYGGGAVVTFTGALADLDLTQPPFVPGGEQPAGAAAFDFDRNGRLDLAVVMRNRDKLWVLFGNGSGGLSPGPSAGVGPGPRDVVAGDVDRDGWPDLVTANSAASTASVLLNSAGSSLTPQDPVPVGGVPIRVALADLNHDGVLDLGALDDSGTPRVAALPGRTSGPLWFDPGTASGVGSGPRGLAVGRFTGDGRVDFVTALSGAPGSAVVVENRSGTPCARSSFAGAPRSYPAGDRPLSTAAADFDEDGRRDLAVVSGSDVRIRILRNAGADFTTLTTVGPLPSPPTAVAAADFNIDGHADLVVARGDPGPGLVEVYLGNGLGGLVSSDIESAGSNTSAVTVGDFNGDGAPDVAATSQTTGFVYLFLGDGAGGLAAGIQTGVGAAPRALVAGFLNLDAHLDLAVANFGSGTVSVLAGNGNGSFTPVLPALSVGANPQGIAAADVDGDGRLDLVTADNSSSQVSVIRRDGSGNFLPAVSYTVGTNPTAVALLDLRGDPQPDIAVTTAATNGAQTLTVLTNTGAGTFSTPGIDHTVRNAPQAITPFDADNDGLLDLAIPCSSSDAVVVLVNRPPGPPVFSAAPRFAVLDKPRAAVSGDFDGNGTLDLAVANSGDSSVSLMNGDGLGGLSQYTTLPAEAAEALVAADFNLDGRIDLAVSAPAAAPAAVKIFFGAAGGAFAPQPSVNVGGTPDDLVAGDFDLDGDVDIALCDKVATGVVRILLNNGPGAGLGTFSIAATTGVGNAPTAIVAADFDRDGDLDLAVANDDSDNVMILRNSPLGSFSVAQTLGLLDGDQSPVSLAVGDFDADGTPDLAAAAFDNDRLHVYRNIGLSFNTTPGTFAVPYLAQFVGAADVNLDGRPDLLAVAAGLSVLRGQGGLLFDAPQTVVAGDQPVAALLADFNRDGRPDVVVVNEGSDDVTLLSSSACQAQRLEVTSQPSACTLAAAGPYPLDAAVTAYDDGGNVASCASASVFPAIVPGTGAAGAVLSDPVAPDVVALGLPLANGAASFTGSNALLIDQPGRRYRLQFTAAGVPPAQTRSFTLGPGSVQILGPASFCAGEFGSYGTGQPADRWDEYRWLVDGAPAAFTPTLLLQNPPLALGPHTLDLTTRIDACTAAAPQRSLQLGDLVSVTLSAPVGAAVVCVNCIGGSIKALPVGGGAVTYQWGYRTESGMPPVVDLPGETADTYVLKGAGFPGPGNYYVVVTVTSACAATVQVSTNEWPVTIQASVPTGEVQHLAASSRGDSTNGQNNLLWVNSTGGIEEIRIRWNVAPLGTSDCLPPPNLGAPYDGEAMLAAPRPTRDDYPHPGLLLNTAYCYSVFVKASGVWSAGRTVRARPFDATAGPVRWAYATGGTAVVPPTVSGPGVLVMSNDRTVHALTRGAAGGEWPPSWTPNELSGVASTRSPVVPFTAPLNGASTVLFAADDAGFVHAFDAATGVRPWPAQGPGLVMTGAPGGIFTQWGGNRDLLFVGTRDGAVNNALRALNLANGTLFEAYAPGASPGPIGPINGTPAIDYATKRVYFASHQRLGGDTLFCLEIADPPAVPPGVLTYKWSRNLGNITGSPVLRGGRVYVGTEAGTIYSIDAADGSNTLLDHVFTPAPFDGPVKGFLFPDRRNDGLIFATDTKVWSVSDGVTSITKNWEWTAGGLNPSLVLYWPQTNYVYVGSANGKLYQLDFSSADLATPPTAIPLTLGDGVATGQIGAPSLDIGVTPRLLVVGSESGVLFGVAVPF